MDVVGEVSWVEILMTFVYAAVMVGMAVGVYWAGHRDATTKAANICWGFRQERHASLMRLTNEGADSTDERLVWLALKASEAERCYLAITGRGGARELDQMLPPAPPKPSDATFAQAEAALRAGCGKPDVEEMVQGIETADWYVGADESHGCLSLLFDGETMIVVLIDAEGEGTEPVRWTLVGESAPEAPAESLDVVAREATRWLMDRRERAR